MGTPFPMAAMLLLAATHVHAQSASNCAGTAYVTSTYAELEEVFLSVCGETLPDFRQVPDALAEAGFVEKPALGGWTSSSRDGIVARYFDQGGGFSCTVQAVVCIENPQPFLSGLERRGWNTPYQFSNGAQVLRGEYKGATVFVAPSQNLGEGVMVELIMAVPKP